MIVPDVNLLLYALFSTFPDHQRSREWWEGALNGDAPVGLAAPVVFGFLRLSTSRRVFAAPLSVETAVAHVTEWLARPQVEYLVDSARHAQIAMDLLVAAGTAGSLTTDAQIAAHALVAGGTVYTHDTDFARFPGVRVVDPLL
jgi:toxin-antitoxin system PIN domain toxin